MSHVMKQRKSQKVRTSKYIKLDNVLDLFTISDCYRHIHLTVINWFTILLDTLSSVLAFPPRYILLFLYPPSSMDPRGVSALGIKATLHQAIQMNAAGLDTHIMIINHFSHLYITALLTRSTSISSLLTAPPVSFPDGRGHLRSILGPATPTILRLRSQCNQSSQLSQQTSLHRRRLRRPSLRWLHRYCHWCFHRTLWEEPQ